jgi:hypothetical protein
MERCLANHKRAGTGQPAPIRSGTKALKGSAPEAAATSVHWADARTGRLDGAAVTRRTRTTVCVARAITDSTRPCPKHRWARTPGEPSRMNAICAEVVGEDSQDGPQAREPSRRESDPVWLGNERGSLAWETRQAIPRRPWTIPRDRRVRPVLAERPGNRADVRRGVRGAGVRRSPQQISKL